MPDLPNPDYALIGWWREDGDFECIAAVNNYQFADDGQTLRALLALIQSNRPDSEDIVVVEAQESLDVRTFADAEKANLPEWTYQPVMVDTCGQGER